MTSPILRFILLGFKVALKSLDLNRLIGGDHASWFSISFGHMLVIFWLGILKKLKKIGFFNATELIRKMVPTSAIDTVRFIESNYIC